MEYSATLSLPSDLFSKICRDMAIFGDTLTIEVKKNQVVFSGSGDLGSGHTTISSDGALTQQVRQNIKKEIKKELNDANEADPSDQDGSKKKSRNIVDGATYIQCSEVLQLSFALRYLTTFSKGSSLASRVEISLSRDAPCQVEYQIEGLGHLRWYLAPKVDGDDI